MSSSLCLALAAAMGSLINVQQLPWTAGESTVFVADADMDGRGELAVLDDQNLTIYESNRDEPAFSVPLPEGASIIDIVDADGDGTGDILLIAGNDIKRLPLTSEKPAPAPVTCFSRANQYSQYGGAPFPGVLVVRRNETPLIALPCAEALELRTLDGELVDSYPIGMDAPRHLTLGEPFSAWANQIPQLGSAGALEFRVSSTATYKPVLPDNDLPLDIADPSRRLGTPRQQREALSQAPDRWPWFPVDRSAGERVRALYAQTEAPGGETAIRIRKLRQLGTKSAEPETGPQRHYPGLLVQHPEILPDFNGDGFNDLLLWKPVHHSPSVDSLARAASAGTWPIRIVVYPYAPDKSRFSARPAGFIELEIPLAWILESGSNCPLAIVFLNDVNGDGTTDFGCLISPREVAIWLSSPGGFGPRPDFTRHFSEPVRAVALEADLEGDGRKTIALQSQHHLYLLRPERAFTSLN